MSKFVKGRFGAFMAGRCPQCQTGRIFETPPINSKFQKVKDHCDHCGVKYAQEPGFFWGAMYFSYAYSVASFIIIGFFFFTFSDDVNLTYYILSVVAFTLLTSPISFRMSRLLMMYIAAPYRKYQKQNS